MNGDPRTRTVTQATRAQQGGVVCEVLSGQGVASRHVLSERPAVVGSEPSVDVVIAEATVSRKHASFEATPRGVRVKDLGSRNGTWYLGASVTDAMVPFGATVRLGKTLVRFVAGADAGADGGPVIDGLQGASVAFGEHRTQLKRVAATDVPVLLRGETGSGKEAAARALHLAGSRGPGPFITFDGAHASAELLDSQLFGHKKGAFTGATENRAGAVELADGGTLFLDGVSELPAEAQVRLLRVLETRKYTRLGDDKPRESDFRLVSASQHDLEKLVRERCFREDLYFRLAVAVIDVPPLRQRAGDVRLLAEHFAAQRGITLDGVTLAAWERAEWPGNVRELKNAVERYELNLSPGGAGPAPVVARSKVIGEVEKSLLVAALEQHRYDVNQAAQQLGLSRSQTYRLMQRHGIEPRKRERGS
ncbi:MAG: sigma 54-dependent Fis family transcriptional regulator [Archangiaceae bacterium]|nr:sigma 54-dependent Fis family transcriptional regulator [Archangiaceae bacterium]